MRRLIVGTIARPIVSSVSRTFSLFGSTYCSITCGGTAGGKLGVELDFARRERDLRARVDAQSESRAEGVLEADLRRQHQRAHGGFAFHE